MQTKAPIILASNSPRRQQLLKEAGIEHSVVVREVDETVVAQIHPRAVAVLIAEQKAKVYADLSQESIVITADTIVAKKGEILGKPKDEAEAISMLQMLSNEKHEVVTGVSIFYKGKFKSFAEETVVHFRELDDSEIRYYISKYKPYDKAGSYGIQEWIGMVGISRIEGDFYNVMGLPVCRLYQELLNF